MVEWITLLAAFVYWLGRQILNLKRGVQFPYAVPEKFVHRY